MTAAADPAAIEDICAGILDGAPLRSSELESLLSIQEESAAEPLFAAARRLRSRSCGDLVFLYGFVYFSTYCRNHCAFCLYRRGNRASPRYRKKAVEVVEVCRQLMASGVHLLDLTMGEDPVMHDEGDFRPLVELVADVAGATGLPIMVSPGIVPPDTLGQLAGVGADWYACYQETHNPELFMRLRLGQSYDERAASRIAAHRAGMLVEDGMLIGVGEGPADRARSIVAMRDAGEQQVRAMTLVPQAGTPFAGCTPPSTWDELLAIAVMRLAMPDRLIPASLDVEGIEGLAPRLRAGANVVTSIVPPSTGLCGVANADYEVDEGLRTVAEVLPRVQELGLSPGSRGEYAAWLRSVRDGPAGRSRRRATR